MINFTEKMVRNEKKTSFHPQIKTKRHTKTNNLRKSILENGFNNFLRFRNSKYW